MKKIILAVVALSFLAVPAAQAQHRHGPGSDQRVERSAQPQHRAAPQRAGQQHRAAPRQQVRKPVVQQRRAVTQQPRWARGKQVPAWQRKHVVRDYHQHGLRRPGPGQQWVKVGNDYLLISILSGIIGGMMVAR